MKLFASLAVLTALAFLGPGTISVKASQDDGVALAIIYDTSGSMRDPVPDNSGHNSPKYVIANRALTSIVRQIQAFSTNTPGAAPRNIQAGLWVFNGNGAREAVKFGPFDAVALESFARDFSQPGGATPLGNALNTAGRAVLKSSLPHKHVLIITDGINTVGPQPASVLPRLKQQADQNQTGLSVHFVAFDVDAKVFDSVKAQGATVVGAANEQQLTSQLEFIVQRKILLEEEEPPKAKK